MPEVGTRRWSFGERSMPVEGDPAARLEGALDLLTDDAVRVSACRWAADSVASATWALAHDRAVGAITDPTTGRREVVELPPEQLLAEVLGFARLMAVSAGQHAGWSDPGVFGVDEAGLLVGRGVVAAGPPGIGLAVLACGRTVASVLLLTGPDAGIVEVATDGDAIRWRPTDGRAVQHWLVDALAAATQEGRSDG